MLTTMGIFFEELDILCKPFALEGMMVDNRQRPFMSITEPGRAAARLAQDWAKLVLDLLRNLVVVAFLFYAAKKSDKWYMWLLAYGGFTAVAVYITAYVNNIEFHFRATSSLIGTLLKLVLILVVFIFVGVVSTAILIALNSVLDEVAKTQAR
jgi:hypothetical protein